MRRAFLFSTVVFIAFLIALVLGEKRRDGGGVARLSPPASAAEPRLGAGFGQVPLQFIPNEGQAGGPVDFYIQGLDKRIFFSQEGLTFVLGGDGPDRWAVKLDFVDPGKERTLVGLEKSGAVISYFKGKPEEWKAGLPAYSKIAYRELWPGIDLLYSGTSNRMKYEFVVRPGADPGRIRLAYRGATTVNVTGEGRLAVETPAGGFQDDVPVAYQEIEGARVGVPVSYSLDRPKETQYGFRVGTYDRSRTLVLDPAVIVSCGYIGGSGNDAAHGIAVDPSGNVYIAGETSSSDIAYPATTGPGYGGGASDAFVAKLDPEGTALLYCAYIGGDGADMAEGIDVDSDGNAYVAGSTDSPETSFPAAVGPDLTYNGGEADAFVAKVDPSGTALVWCGYVGGAESDRATDIDLVEFGSNTPPDRSLFITGSTSSSEATFPVAAAGPSDQTYNGGPSDAFAAGIDHSTGVLFNCGYIGGSERDEGLGVAQAFDPGEWGGGRGSSVVLYVVGMTSSTETTFPVAGSPETLDQTYNGGESDAFVARLPAQSSVPIDLCGYIGGSGSDAATDVDVRASDDFMGLGVLITGFTSSTETTFPVIGGPDLTYNGGDSDAFVAALGDYYEPFGIVYCGYIGGSGSDRGLGIFGGPDICHVTGSTSSTESTFPVRIGPDLTYNGGLSDAFVARVAIGAADLPACGYIGGSGSDRAEAVAGANVAGATGSGESTFPVAVGPDLTFNGVSDAFAAKLRLEPPRLDALAPEGALAGGQGFSLSMTGADFADGAEVKWGGENRPATFISPSEVRASIGAGDLAMAGYVDVQVENPDGDLTNSLDFSVYHPTPTISSLSPADISGGGGNFDLTVMGSGFEAGAVVQLNGSDIETVFKSASELQAVFPAGFLDLSWEIPVTAANPVPNLGSSNIILFPVRGFTVASEPASATVNAGQTATYNILISSHLGSFDSAVTLSCADLPYLCTATFSPATVTPGASQATTTLTLATTGPSGLAAGHSGPVIPPASASILAVLMASLWLIFSRSFSRSRRRRCLAATILICLAVLTFACVSTEISEPKTPSGNHSVTVRGISGSLTATTEIILTVR